MVKTATGKMNDVDPRVAADFGCIRALEKSGKLPCLFFFLLFYSKSDLNLFAQATSPFI